MEPVKRLRTPAAICGSLSMYPLHISLSPSSPLADLLSEPKPPILDPLCLCQWSLWGLGKIGLAILLASRASSTCYYRDGTIAEEDEPCPNSNSCCPSGATCQDNLLCRDENNFLNGSTVTFPGGTYNYTDLYHTSSCQSRSYDGCSVQCTTSTHPTEFLLFSQNKSCNRYLTLITQMIPTPANISGRVIAH
jgi:hypothetical protein